MLLSHPIGCFFNEYLLAFGFYCYIGILFFFVQIYPWENWSKDKDERYSLVERDRSVWRNVLSMSSWLKSEPSNKPAQATALSELHTITTKEAVLCWLVTCICWFVVCLTLAHQKWQWYVHLQCWVVSKLRGIITQKTELSIATAVRQLNTAQWRSTVMPFFTSPIDGVEWSASCLCHCYRNNPVPIHCIGDWVDPRANLDALKKGEM